VVFIVLLFVIYFITLLYLCVDLDSFGVWLGLVVICELRYFGWLVGCWVMDLCCCGFYGVIVYFWDFWL